MRWLKMPARIGVMLWWWMFTTRSILPLLPRECEGDKLPSVVGEEDAMQRVQSSSVYEIHAH